MKTKSRRHTAIRTPKAEQRGFRHKFGEVRPGLPPADKGWRPVPEFHYYIYVWWYNPNIRRFAVSMDYNSDGWAMLVNKDLNEQLLDRIDNWDAFLAQEEKVRKAMEEWKAGRDVKASSFSRS